MFFGADNIEMGDAGIEMDVFENVPVRVVVWSGDGEFLPEATILFDRSITEIFPTEDVTAIGS